MNPLLLLALVGGGAFVAAKVVVPAIVKASGGGACGPQTPVPNPFFDKAHNVDYLKISDAITTASKTERLKRDAKVMQYAASAAAVANLVPVYGQVAAGIILAAGALYGAADQVIAKMKDDPNGSGYAADLDFWAREWGIRGWLPAQPGPGESLKASYQNLHDTIAWVGDPSREPYMVTLAALSGKAFAKWGGSPEVLPYAAYFTADEVGCAVGSFPFHGDHNRANNLPRLKLYSMCAALEYGVQCDVGDVYAEAARGNADYERILDWKTEFALPDHPAVENARVFYSFLCGVHAATVRAAALAKKPGPPPLTEAGVRFPDGQIPQGIIDAHSIRLVKNFNPDSETLGLGTPPKLGPWKM